MSADGSSSQEKVSSSSMAEENGEGIVGSGGGVQLDEFRRDGVVMLAKTELDGADVLCSGSLVVRSATLGAGPMLKWVPDSPAQPAICGSLSDRDWAVVSDRNSSESESGGGDRGVALGGSGASKVFVRPIVAELSDLRSFQLSEDGNQLTLIQTDGTRHPPLIFLDDGPEVLINVLRRFMVVRQSGSDANLYLLTDARIDALDLSLSQLNLFDKTHTDAVWKFVSDIKKDPYTTALSAFSKITDKLIFSPMEDDERPEEEMAELLHKSLHQMGSLNGLQVTTGHREDGEFEVVTPRRRLLDHLPLAERGESLCQLDWELHFDEQGRIVDLQELRGKIFRGGVEHGIRTEVWKFLLGLHDWHSSTDERQASRTQKVDDYFRMKMQWRTISAEQEERFSAFRERKSQIEKDVSRTDRTHPFFKGPDNANVKLLHDVLMTYVMFDFDLGYVQGMSDLLAPILFVMENEVDAFWCFVGFMKRVSQNFDFDQGGIKNQLQELSDLTRCLDPDFFAYLDAKDSGNFYFCFRWLLIWFKRELPFTDLMRLWEVIWSDLPCKNFHLLVCLALMETERHSIMENGFGFNEILKHVNDMSHRIDLPAVLKKAEGIWRKVKAVADDLQPVYSVGNDARRVLGLENAIPRPASTSSVEVIDEQAQPPLPPGASEPVTIANGRRSRGVGGEGSCSSLNESSSLEVISEDDSARFESALLFT